MKVSAQRARMDKPTTPYLLDTHTFIWWITDSPQLSRHARDVIANPNHRIILSAVSAWEIAIKTSLDRLREVGDPEISVPFHAQRNGFEVCAFSLEAALRVFKLPPIHQDPFDRALIAHASVLSAVILSADSALREYSIKVEW